MSRTVRTFSHVRPNQNIQPPRGLRRRKKSGSLVVDFYEYNRSLIEASLDPLVTIGAGGKITDVNAATEQVTGCPRSELIGADFSDYFTEPGKARAGYQQVFRDGTVQNYALEIRHRDGHITPVLYNASVFRDAQGNVAGVFAAAREITEQKRAEQALQQLNQGLEVRVAERTKELVHSEERFAKAFQANPTAMVITELASGKIVDVNQSYLKLFLFTREEMIGHTAAELKLISSPGEREKPIQILREQGKVNNYATPLRLKSGEIRYALVSQEKFELEGRTCVLSSLNDITTHKKAEDALRESEQRFKAIADHTPDHILMQDRDLRYTLVVNPQVGLTEKDMLGKTDVEILGWEDAEKLTQIKRRVLETGVPIHLETAVASKTGEQGIFDGTFVPHRDEQGRVDGIIGYFRNVTERKQAEAELTRLASFPALNPRPILEISLDGQIEYANPAARKEFPDLPEKIVEHPYFEDWPKIVEKVHHDQDLIISRDIQVGERYFQQSIHYVKKYDRLRVYGADITDRVHAQQALTESQTLLSVVMEGAPDPIYLKDRDSRILLANPATLAVIGKPAEQVMGKNDAQYYDDPAVGAAIMETDRRVMESGSTQVIEERVSTPGAERVFLSTKTPYRDPQGQVIGLIGLSRDITERKNREEELNRLNRTLKALSNINQAMMRANNETDFMQEVCRIVVEDCGHAMVWIGNVEHDEGKTIRPVASSGFEEGYLETLQLTWADTERGRGPSGTAIRTGKMSTCKNMLTDPQFTPWRAEAIKRGYASSIVFPLFADGEVFGELTIYSREPDPFSKEEINLLAELASDLAYGISLLRLREAHAHTEAALAINEERYRSLFNGMTEGFALHEIVCNENGQPIDYRFIEMNPAFERLTGLERSKLEGQLKSVTMPGDDPYWLEVYAKVAMTGQPLHYENYSSELDQFYEVDAYCPKPGQFATIFRNVTERKKAQERVFLQAHMLAAVGQGVIGVDLQGKITYWNPAATRLCGWQTKEVTGRKMAEVILPEDQAPLERFEQIMAAIESGDNWTNEITVKRHDESLFPALVTFAPVRDEFGPLTGVIGIFTDLTERKQIEENLNQSLRNVEFLSECAVHLLQPMTGQAALAYVADQIYNLAGNALVMVNEYDPQHNSTVIRAMRGDSAEVERLMSLIGMNLVGMAFPFAPAARQRMRQGELNQVEGGLYNLSYQHIPQALSKKIENVLGLGDIYTMAFSTSEDLIGTVVILTHGQGLPGNAAVIAGLIGQAGIALTRIRAEQGRQAVLEELEIEKERWQTTVESMLDPVMVANADGQVDYMNSAAMRMSGRSVLPMLGIGEYPSYYQLNHPDGTLFTPNDLPLQRAALFGEEQQNVEIMQRNLQGGEHNVLWNAAPLHNPNGGLAGAVAVGRDISLQRKVEAELRASEERFRGLVEFAPDAIFVHRDGRWVYANPYGLELLRAASLEDIVGRSVLDTFGEDCRELVKQRIKKALNDEEPTPLQELQMIRRDGSYVDVETRGTSILFDGQPSVIVVVKDISVRKIAEEGLKQSEQRYRTLFETMTQGIVYLDTEARIISANLAAQRILHLTFNELNGQSAIYALSQTIHEDLSHFLPEEHPVTQSLRSGKPIYDVIMGNINLVTGGITWIKMDAVPQFHPGESQPYQVYAVLDDITARKRAEAERDRALDEAMRRAAELDAVFNSIADGVMLTDFNGEVLRLNPAAERIFNYSQEQLKLPMSERGRLPRLLAANGQPLSISEYPGVKVLRGETVHNMVLSLSSPWSGRDVWISLSAAPVRTGKDLGAVLSFTDISERMEMEKDLRQARDELEERVQERTAELTTILTALRESEERFRQLAENIREVFVLFTPGELQPFYVSPAYAELVGLAPESLYEDPNSFLEAIYAEDRPDVGTLLDMINQGKFDQQYRMLRPDGNLRWVRVRGFPVRNKQGELYRVAAIIEDVTTEVEAYQILEQRVEERTRELATLLSYTEKLASTLELKPVLQIMLDQLCSVVDYDGAAVLLLEGNELVAVEYQGPTPEDEILNIRFPASISFGLSKVIETRAAVIFRDIQTDSEEASQFRQADVPIQKLMIGKARSWLGVPLIVKNQLLGILRLSHTQPDRFNPRHAQLVTAIANQAAMAVENAQLYDKSRQLAALGERQRLARELHDSVSQALYGISLGTHTAIALSKRDPEKLEDVLKYVLSLAEAGLTEMRALIFELRPDSLETDGLVGALNRHAAATQARRGVTVKMNLCDEIQMPIEVKEALYRISQEAMQNAVKHANPTEICLELSCSEHFVEMLVMDDGQGFDTSQAFPGHLGLRSMSERATRLGGTMEIDSEPGKGTRVKVKLPI